MPFEFEWNRGVRLLGHDLWFDATRYDVLSFVSSARVRDAWRHSRAICTDKTKRLLRVFKSGFRALSLPYGRRVQLGQVQIVLLPAGFMPGSAQIKVETDFGTALYINNICLETHAMSEPAQVSTADFLVLNVAYGNPHFEFPRRRQAYEHVVDLAKSTIESGRTPVFLTTAVGKAQEVIRALNDRNIKVEVHRSIDRFCRCYRALGFDPGPYKLFKGSPSHGSTLVFPEHLRRSPAIKRIKRAGLFWVSGLALSREALERMHVSAGIALSGHLDWRGLLELIELSRPRFVLTVGRYAEEFASHLCAQGLEAKALHQEVQLSLF